MKKKFIAACALVLSALAFTACGSTNQKLTFDPNWRSNVLSETPAGTKETLTYKIEFEENSFLQKDYFTVKYCATPGSYVTTLEYLEDDTYKYVTELSVPVEYTMTADKTQTKAFTDVIKTETVFKKASEYLKPVYSKETAHCYSPNNFATPKIEYAYTEYHYEFLTEYNDSLTKGTLTRTDKTPQPRTLLPENRYPGGVSKTSFEIDQKKYTYLENDQLLFAFRGLSNSAIAVSKTVSVYNASLLSMERITTTPAESAKTTFNLSIGGQETKPYTIEYTPISIKSDNKNSGISQTLWYAKTTSNTANQFRNALLKIVVPMHFGLGTLTYTLTKADFSVQA